MVPESKEVLKQQKDISKNTEANLEEFPMANAVTIRAKTNKYYWRASPKYKTSIH